MGLSITVRSVSPRLLAAVRRKVVLGAVGAAWGPALDQVWTFLRANPGLREGGHNVFVYHHPARRDLPMDVDFGVEVVRRFEPAGEVVCVETPRGEVASAIHRGGYDRLRLTHDAIHEWRSTSGRELAGVSWEIYGDPHPDPASTETTVEYLLA